MTQIKKYNKTVVLTIWRVQDGQLSVSVHLRRDPRTGGMRYYCFYDRSFNCDHATAVREFETANAQHEADQPADSSVCVHCGERTWTTDRGDQVCTNQKCFAHGS